MTHKNLKWYSLAVGLCLVSCGATSSAQSPVPQSADVANTIYTLTVTLAGTSTGTVTSKPAGIDCPSTCSGSFASGTVVKLTAKAGAGAFFAGWSGACSGMGVCTVTMNSNLEVTATFNVSQTVNVLNHIIFMAQENRGLDHYFGELRAFWRENKVPDISFDGLPQFNPTSGVPLPLRATADEPRL